MTTLRYISSILSLLCVSTIVHAFVSPYNEAQGMTSLYLSIATFCPVETYSTRTFCGPTEGFVVTRTIEDKKTDATGFIGYLPSDASIYVALRGSSSAKNWYSDLKVDKVNYTTFPECECQVADGFYSAALSITGIMIAEVKRLQQQFPSYRIKLTGHSYGAALSQLLSMELVAAGIPCTVYNFGQPRTGDLKYASFATTLASTTAKLETWRVVHNRDIVPHWPFNDGLGYYHVCTEEFEDEDGVLHSCGTTPIAFSGASTTGSSAASGSRGYTTCEDPGCSDQYDQVRDWRPDEHMTYLGVPIDCSSVSA